MFALLVSLHTIFAPVPAAPVHYKLINKSTVDLGMGGMPPIALTMTAFVSITMTDSAAGKVANVVIDSSTFDAGEMGAAMAGAMGDSPNGVTLRAFVVNGKLLQQVTPSAMNVQAMQLAPAIQLLLSGTRSAHAGDTWTDSTVADTSVSAMATKASLLTQWKATAGTAGAMQYDGTVTGTTSVGGGQMQLEMQTTGTSHVTTRVGQLPATATSASSGSGSMNMGGQAMTMKLSTEVSATLIP